MGNFACTGLSITSGQALKEALTQLYKMKKARLLILFAVIILLCFSKIQAQIYLESVGGIKKLNICNCEVTEIAPIGSGAIAASQNQNPVYLEGEQVFSYNIVTGNSTLLGNVMGGSNNLVVAENGLIYMVGVNAAGTGSFLGVLNPTTGVFTNLGDLPTGLFASGDLFFYNGLLYMLGGDNVTSGVFEIPIANPAASLLVFDNPTLGIGAASFYVGGIQKVFVSVNNGITDDVFELDMTTGALTLVCPTIQSIFDMGAWSGLQFNACCANDAGHFQSLSLVQACADESITLNHLGDEVLNPGAALSFVLVTDSTATLPTGILQISATPTFTFNAATMQVNTIYFVAAVAAPGPAGAPDWSSTCIDLSYFAKVKWNALPTFQVLSIPPAVCANGCAEVSLLFSGNFPINLSWSMDIGSQNLTGVFSADTPNEVLSICPPPGQNFPTGSLNLQFLSISDGNCACP
jgi:hypothetical protein